MQEIEEIKEYCNDVCGQIRWKKIKPAVAVEIERHLYDQRNAYIASGEDEASATRKSIVQMGDAVFLGQTLDKIHKPIPQWSMLILTTILLLTGFAVNLYIGWTINPIGNYFITYSLLSIAPAFIILLFCYFLDFSTLIKYPFQYYIAVLVISLLGVLADKGIYAGLSLIGQRLSHLALVFPLAYALFICGMRNKGLRGVLFSGIGYLPFAAVLWMLTTASGLIFYTIAALIILCFAIARGWFGGNRMQAFLLVLIPTFTIFALVTSLSNFTRRFRVLMNPYEDRFGGGYVHCLIREFLSNAVFLGKGGVPQLAKDITDVPYIHTDYALVYFIHQFGFVVLLGVMLVFTLFYVIGVRKIAKQTSVSGSIIAFAVLATFMVQSTFYMIDNLGYGIVSSFPLPLVSYGRTALLINAALTGFMLSVFRTGEIFRDSSLPAKQKPVGEKHPIFSYENGKLIVDLQPYRNT